MGFLKKFLEQSAFWAQCIKCKGYGYFENRNHNCWDQCEGCDGLGVLDPSFFKPEEVSEFVPVTKLGVYYGGREVNEISTVVARPSEDVEDFYKPIFVSDKPSNQTREAEGLQADLG